MKKIKISWLFLTLILLLILPQLEKARGWSDQALIQRKVFENPDVWRLTKGYANSEWGVDLFAYPYSASQAYLLVGTTLHTGVTFISDYAFHRIIYIECYSDWIRAYGSFGSGDGQFNSPSGIDCEYDHDEGGNYYVYVADTWNNRIVTLKYDWQSEQMSWLGAITGGGLALPKDIDINNGGDWFYRPNDKIWVANGDGTIKKFDLNGNLLLTYGEHFGIPKAVACGRSDLITYPPYEPFANNNYIYVIEDRWIHQFLENPPGNIEHIQSRMLAQPVGWWMKLTSVDVDNFGQVWTTVVKEQWGTGYQESYIFKDTPDLETLCDFNAGGIFNRLQNFSNAGGNRGCGNVFILEEWDDESGGLYYAIGTDILNYYTYSNEEHWCHFVNYTLVDPSLISVKVYNEDGAFIKMVKDTIPQFLDFSGYWNGYYWWDGYDTSGQIAPSGNYRIETTAYSGYVNINTGEHVNIVVQDGWVYHIDYSEPLNTPTITSIAAIDTSIYLEWDDNNNNELGYIIEKKDITNNEWNVIDTTTWDVESYTDYQMVGSETYYYRIKAYNYFGSTGYSNEVTCKARPWPPIFNFVGNWYCNRRFRPVKMASSGEDPGSLGKVFGGKIGDRDCPSPYPDSILSDVSELYGEEPVNQKQGTYVGVVIRTKSCKWYNHNYIRVETTFVDPSRMVIYTKPDTVYCTDWRYWFQIATVDIDGDTSMWTPGDWSVDYSCCVGDCHIHIGPYPVHLKTQPEDFCLNQNYPNPFNPQTEISYSLPKESRVRLTIYNLLGQRVRVLVDKFETPGFKRVHWDGRDEEGKEVASGIYFYRLQAGEYNKVRKMVVIK